MLRVRRTSMTPSPCPACRQPTVPGLRFCGYCGISLPAACAACGFVNPAPYRFCANCGAALTLTSTATPSVPPALPKPLVLEEQFTSFQQTLPRAFRDQLLTEAAGENRVLTIL